MMQTSENHEETIVLALNTLGTMDFNGEETMAAGRRGEYVG
jgi:hypothetical protein